MLLIGIGAVLLVAAVLGIRRRMVIVSVSGPSMIPTLHPGDRLLVRRVPLAGVRLGDVVVVRESGPCRPGDPTGARGIPWIVKRVVALPGDPEPDFLPRWARGTGVVASGMLLVLGDNHAVSRDSRHFGAVPAERVLGIAIRRLGGDKLAVRPPSW
ncbi:S26 family signal peptidase [Nonomuraea jiangxiensis]|nr:S26 family signal peptidase [Nonomuraea jiangxiensis]